MAEWLVVTVFNFFFQPNDVSQENNCLWLQLMITLTIDLLTIFLINRFISWVYYII